MKSKTHTRCTPLKPVVETVLAHLWFHRASFSASVPPISPMLYVGKKILEDCTKLHFQERKDAEIPAGLFFPVTRKESN